MFKSLAFLSLLTVAAANAQAPDSQAPQPTSPEPTSPAAPIVRSYHSALRQPMNQIVETQPVIGVWLRCESQSGNQTGDQTAVQTVSATPQRAEFRLDRGRLNVTVHHPADHTEVLVDLPGGQISLLKDGLYTFNADTNTVRVLRGEAAYIGSPATADAKPIKIKEDHRLSLVSATATTKPGELKSVDAYPYELTADLLPHTNDDRAYSNHGDGYSPYGYPYYAGAWGYPGYYSGYYGYGYPISYGIGFGYYGGFGRGFGGFRR